MPGPATNIARYQVANECLETPLVLLPCHMNHIGRISYVMRPYWSNHYQRLVSSSAVLAEPRLMCDVIAGCAGGATPRRAGASPWRRTLHNRHHWSTLSSVLSGHSCASLLALCPHSSPSLQRTPRSSLCVLTLPARAPVRWRGR